MAFRHGCYLPLLLVATFTVLNMSVVRGASPSRVKRHLIQFGLMIFCETWKNPLDYNNYGCWCGKGGSGTPKDGVDRCCRVHDACYDRIIRDNICNRDSDVYYEWYSRIGCSRCAFWNDACERAICECDGAAARCFKRNTYNQRYKNWPKDRC